MTNPNYPYGPYGKMLAVWFALLVAVAATIGSRGTETATFELTREAVACALGPWSDSR